jgi:HEPN domain-containing protein
MVQEYLIEGVSGEMVRVSRGEFAQTLFERAEKSLCATRALILDGHWAGACFAGCTAAGQALESYLIYAGSGRGETESVGAMAQMCAEFESEFSQVIRIGKYLDRYYAITRYPDALPRGAVPYLWFGEDDAEQAMQYAAEIVDFTRSRF